MSNNKNKDLLDKNKDLIFNKLYTISLLPENLDWKTSNYKKLSDKYKKSLEQLKNGNDDFLKKFNTLYSCCRYNELSEYIDTLESKNDKTKSKK
jgi:hypothetical protein